MTKNPGCWANALDDCDGPLTGEHSLSVAIFSPPPGLPSNRSGRLRRQIDVEGFKPVPKGEKRTMRVRQLVSDILCDRHNNATNQLDTEAGNFARAVDQWVNTQQGRSKLPGLRWNRRTYSVSGPLLERWLMKTAVNNRFKGDLPLGGAHALPGWPTRELVEMIFGQRQISGRAGLFALAALNLNANFAETFELNYFHHNNTHIAGCIISFRTLRLGIHFEDVELSARIFCDLPGLSGCVMQRPFKGFSTDEGNVELRLVWDPSG
jgi:hypothetical protein